jgi:hypothetical protein
MGRAACAGNKACVHVFKFNASSRTLELTGRDEPLIKAKSRG